MTYKNYMVKVNVLLGEIWNLADRVLPFTEDVEQVKDLIQDFYADTLDDTNA